MVQNQSGRRLNPEITKSPHSTIVRSESWCVCETARQVWRRNMLHMLHVVQACTFRTQYMQLSPATFLSTVASGLTIRTIANAGVLANKLSVRQCFMSHTFSRQTTSKFRCIAFGGVLPQASGRGSSRLLPTFIRRGNSMRVSLVVVLEFIAIENQRVRSATPPLKSSSSKRSPATFKRVQNASHGTVDASSSGIVGSSQCHGCWVELLSAPSSRLKRTVGSIEISPALRR